MSDQASFISMVFNCLYCCHKEITSFVSTKQINLLYQKFRHISTRCKRVLEAANFIMLVKQKNVSLPRNLAQETFGKLLIPVFSTKVNPLHLLYLMVLRCSLLHVITQKMFPQIFLGTLILLTPLSFYVLSHLELNCVKVL